jgi:hypothetical protein
MPESMYSETPVGRMRLSPDVIVPGIGESLSAIIMRMEKNATVSHTGQQGHLLKCGFASIMVAVAKFSKRKLSHYVKRNTSSQVDLIKIIWILMQFFVIIEYFFLRQYF